MPDTPFYGEDQAAIHHSDFGNLARDAATLLLSLLGDAGLRHGTVVDLGSGSGILARVVCDAGYRVRGVDISSDMVKLASEHAPAATFRCGSLLDAEIPRAVAVTALGEALNYATDPRAGLEELDRQARRVRQSLEPGGVFLFDISSPGWDGPTGARQQFHDRDSWTLYMRAEESPDRTRSDRFITIFRTTGPHTSRRSDEHHVLRLYDLEEVRQILRRVGFDVEVLTDYPSGAPRKALPDWNVFVARLRPQREERRR